MALRYELATYDPVTFLVGDEIVSGTPTFVHADTIYAKCADGYYHSFGVNKRVVKNGRYVDDDNVYADAITTQTLDVDIIASSDDSEEFLSDGQNTYTSSDLELAYDPDALEDQLVGLRFTNITIPKDSTITAAYLSFRADGDMSATCNLYIDAEASDDAITFTANNSDISNRTLTGTDVDWLAVESWTNGNWYDTPSIISLISAITSRTNWVSGNAIVFVISGDAGDTRRAESYDGLADSSPKLHIEYETGDTGLLDPLPMTVYQPASGNNIQTYSNDMSQWVLGGNAARAQDATDLEGVSNNAWTVSDNGTSDWAHVVTPPFADIYSGTAKVWIKKETSINHCGTIYLLDVSTVQYQLSLSTETGSYYDRDANLDAVKIIDDGINWIVLIEFSGALKVNRLKLSPANIIGDDPSVDSTASATGDMTALQTEIYSGKTIAEVENLGPIFTTAAADATDEIINTYPSANWSNSEGPIYIEFDYTREDQVILLNDDVPILYVTSDVLYLDDGTNTTSIACSTVGEHKAGIALDSSGGSMRLNLDGTWAD